MRHQSAVCTCLNVARNPGVRKERDDFFIKPVGQKPEYALFVAIYCHKNLIY
jgi:hypothetical protein